GADANGFSLQSNCTLRGLAKVVAQGTAGAFDLGNGKFGIPVLQNPLPGQYPEPSLAGRSDRSASDQQRHEQLSADNFGQITSKGSNVNNLPRTFQGKLRFSF